MGTQDRFFARWLLPVYPFLCLLAAYGALQALAWPRRPGAAAVAVARVLLCAQGLVFAIHNDVVLARDDTRQLARDWMVEHVPAGTKVVIEPVMPDAWASDPGRALRGTTGNGARWAKWPTSRSRSTPTARCARAARADRQARGLRAHAVPGARRRSTPRAATAGADRLDAVRPRAGRARGRPAGDQVLRRAQAQRPRRRPARTPARADRSRSTSRSTTTRSSYDRPGPEIVIYRLHGGRAVAVGEHDPPADTVTTLLQTDHAPLARAIELAERAAGGPARTRWSAPWSSATAQMLGEGWHAAYGARTPSVEALAACGDADVAGATLYVSLEPCCHQGQTPPCTDAILEARLARVVVASDDPTEKASGRGLGILRDEGVEVGGRRRRARRARPLPQPGRSASTRAPAARRCCSSRR